MLPSVNGKVGLKGIREPSILFHSDYCRGVSTPYDVATFVDKFPLRMKIEKLTTFPLAQKIKVLLAEDHQLCRKALKLLLKSSDDIKVVGEAKNGAEALRLTKSLLPEVIVLDISMPLLNGIEATHQILKILPKSRVLILSANPEPEYIKQAVLCGASGYLIKQFSTQVLVEAVREVNKGNSFFCAPISKSLRCYCRKLFEKRELLKRKAARLAVSKATG
jgi:DNA-binding NarL/FixJ family response regulator